MIDIAPSVIEGRGTGSGTAPVAEMQPATCAGVSPVFQGRSGANLA